MFKWNIHHEFHTWKTFSQGPPTNSLLTFLNICRPSTLECNKIQEYYRGIYKRNRVLVSIRMHLIEDSNIYSAETDRLQMTDAS